MPTAKPAPRSSDSPSSDSPPTHWINLRPRPRLFFGLLIALAVWVAFLIVMYFTTIPPRA
jgi:ABC-type uncharacterized transport system permease subunit